MENGGTRSAEADVKKICAICGERDDSAHEFEFYYGKKTSEAVVSKVEPSAHRVDGNFKAPICHSCYNRNHYPVIFAGIFAIVTLLSGSLYVQFRFQLDGYPFALSFFYILAGIGVYQNYAIIKKYKTGVMSALVADDGAKQLIKEKKSDFISRGYDTFWTPDEYRQMQRKSGSLPERQPE